MEYEDMSNNLLEIHLFNLINGRDGERYAPTYCTDWDNTMRLAIEYGLSLYHKNQNRFGKYLACHSDEYGFNHHATSDDSPLRAIVICLIKVLESNNEQ